MLLFIDERLTWSLQHSLIVFGPHHLWARYPFSIAVETYHRTDVNFEVG